MRTTASAKRCPECGKVTVLHAQDCTACGHQFRTRFEEPADRTEAFDAVMLPRPPAPPVHPFPAPRRRRGLSPFVQAFLGAFCLVAAVGLVIGLTWSWSQGVAGRGSRPAAPASSFSLTPSRETLSAGPAEDGARRLGAEDLYERIGMAMSLYDVDQAAGGMGRVIRSSNPHVLLLSYDYPGLKGLDQSVRVSLYRTDPDGDDYRVQAVALYHGHTLLHRHADDN